MTKINENEDYLEKSSRTIVKKHKKAKHRTDEDEFANKRNKTKFKRYLNDILEQEALDFDDFDDLDD